MSVLRTIGPLVYRDFLTLVRRSNQYPQSMILSKNKKISNTPANPSFCYIRVGLKVVYISWRCFSDFFVLFQTVSVSTLLRYSHHQIFIFIGKLYLSLCVRKQKIWVPTRSGTNRPVQSQKQTKSLKFWVIVEKISVQRKQRR